MSIKKLLTGFICAAVAFTSVIVSPQAAKVAEAAEANELKVGAAVRDITPTEENGMLPMSSGLARQKLVAVIDPLHVRVIAMNDGQKTALMVAWELGDTPAPTEFVNDLAEETGVERDAIFYCATHSHAVPDAIKMDLEDPWMVYAHEQMLAAAKEAIANMEPASVGIGYTDSYINVNRNRTYSNRRTQGYNPEGVSDKELALIRFDSVESGDPIAFVVNYAVHGVVMYANRYVELPGETDFRGNQAYGVGVSSDLPGYVSTCIENKFEDSVALWISGAAGNQNPILGNEYFVPDPDTGAQQTKYFTPGAEEILEFLGSVQFADVLEANAEITETNSNVEISYGFDEEYIPGPTEESDDFRASLHMLRFGDIALLGSSGELFCEYGLTLKAESAVENTLVVNNAATYSDEYRTYMCTDADIEIGQGQGVNTKIYAPGYLSNALVSMMNDLEGAPAATAASYYKAGDTLKNQNGDYEGALEQFVLGAAVPETDDNKADIANCLVQIGECCVHLEKGPNGETGDALKEYVLGAWERAGQLGNGTGYFDLGLAYIGIEVPGAGFADCLGLANDEADQKTGFAYLEKALELKNGKAQRYIGICYENGYGVEQSYEKAYECFSKTNGADLYIARYKLFGIAGLDQDIDSAVATLVKKANSMAGGNRTEAQTARLLLAELYYTGSYSETLYDGTVVTATIDELDRDAAMVYLGYHQDEHGLSDAEVQEIIDGFNAKAIDYYKAGDALKNKSGDYEGALEQFVRGAALDVTDENKEAIANCLVQIGECCVYLEKGPNGETGDALRDYVLGAWERAGQLGNGTGYFDLGLAHIGIEVPGAGFADCLGLANDEADQKTGFAYLEKALELKNGKAQRYIGICYENGYGVEQSYEKAYECFSKTGGAELYIARYKLFGIAGLDQDIDSAVETLIKKANSMAGGNRTEAQTARLLLAELYYTGSYSEVLYDGTIATATIDELDKEAALKYLGYHKDEHGLSDAEVDEIIAGFENKAAAYYKAGDALKNTDGDYAAALEQFVLGASVAVNDDNKADVANCLVQIGECCVRLERGPKGETGDALRDYVLGCWERAGELGNGTGYFDLALAYIGIEIPGAGFGDCLGLANDKADQEKGFAYLEDALELKNGKAQRYIGICYENGYGVEQSYEKAYECFSKTNGAELYIARYKLFGIAGLDQDIDGALETLVKKAESMKGGNRTETQTARLMLAELYYTGSYSETLYDGTVVTATIDKLDEETALKYIGYHQDEYGLSDAETNAIVAEFKVKVVEEEIAELKSQIAGLESTKSSQASNLQAKTAELEKKTQELNAAKQELANAQFTSQTVTLKKVTPKKKKINVSWKKVSGAAGYEISYSLKANFKGAKKVTTNKAKVVIKKLKTGKKYYVRVRAYKNVNGKKVYTQYGVVSASVKVK